MENSYYTITEITNLIKKNLENNPDLNSIWLKGEISNLTYHSSGHIYFTLKDKGAVISAVFFKNSNKKLNFRLEEGMSVLVLGSINVFEKRGSYQFILSDLKIEGIGELLKQIEQLKNKLDKEGIFDPSHKKKLPYLPKRIGVVTSPTGAAIRDIIKVAMRRFPNIEIIIAPAKVQGEDAAVSIVKGINELNNNYDIDLIIAGRGGGSFEDLMPFNNEDVIRAFYNSDVPIISAVGHQIDHPLCDEAADYAAPTPSAAAEIAIPEKSKLQDFIETLNLRLNSALSSIMAQNTTKIDAIMNLRIFKNPKEIIFNQELLFTDIENNIISTMKDKISDQKNRFLMLPDLNRIMKNVINEKKNRLETAILALKKLSPNNVLKRGYSITTDEEGEVIKSIESLNIGDNLNILFADGSANCKVNQTLKEVKIGEDKSSN
ncbi:MAG: exodeoxyribonuclease VII large subunit [Spirochaetota bacterium]|nr:exodeoxyribonuclease VII large subunit [Spirochaetota bacterium]